MLSASLNKTFPSFLPCISRANHHACEGRYSRHQLHLRLPQHTGYRHAATPAPLRLPHRVWNSLHDVHCSVLCRGRNQFGRGAVHIPPVEMGSPEINNTDRLHQHICRPAIGTLFCLPPLQTEALLSQILQ